MKSQPTYNIGLLGSVSAGKTTTVKAFTGIDTFKFAKEKEQGITMKIGYANCKIFRCQTCPEPQCYYSTCSKTTTLECNICGSQTIHDQYFSFIDCPGHESLMNIMLSGTTIMDYAILLIDGSQKCPQNQTIEHLAALEILQIKKIIIIQNKLDLLETNKALEQLADIKKFVKGTGAESAPIIPFSAQKKYNIDIICEYIVKYFGHTDRIIAPPKMNIIRSFDVNKPGCNITDITGGVIGGSLVTGELRIGDMIEIRPGIVKKDNNKLVWKPIQTEIISMKTDMDNLSVAAPGGLIGLCTNLDPVLTRSDRMVGQVVGLPGSVPPVYLEINAKCMFMQKIGVVGTKVIPPGAKAVVLLNISSKPVNATVKKVKKSLYMFELSYPCCMDIGERFSISSKIGDSWRLIGMGTLIG